MVDLAEFVVAEAADLTIRKLWQILVPKKTTKRDQNNISDTNIASSK